MYGYRCEYCDGTVRLRAIERESFKHKDGFIVSFRQECVTHCGSE